MNRKDTIDEILYQREDGETCVELAEAYTTPAVKKADPKLYSALKRLNDAAEDMVSRLQELNEELELGYEDV